MALMVSAEPVPLVTDADGVVRVGGTRVTLDTVVAAFRDGVSAEGIAEQYPALQLPHVYAVIAYYLNHREEVEAYLRARADLARQVRQENESRFEPLGVRERLLARKPQG